MIRQQVLTLRCLLAKQVVNNALVVNKGPNVYMQKEGG